MAIRTCIQGDILGPFSCPFTYRGPGAPPVPPCNTPFSHEMHVQPRWRGPHFPGAWNAPNLFFCPYFSSRARAEICCPPNSSLLGFWFPPPPPPPPRRTWLFYPTTTTSPQAHGPGILGQLCFKKPGTPPTGLNRGVTANMGVSPPPPPIPAFLVALYLVKKTNRPGLVFFFFLTHRDLTPNGLFLPNQTGPTTLRTSNKPHFLQRCFFFFCRVGWGPPPTQDHNQAPTWQPKKISRLFCFFGAC